ncbi:hypothetical protein VT84_01875 [Gemmata sp. SH-PL17]|uniref:type II toxin-antitoxin system Phd/YefM family antitoxin n=1 Tax=Gemmata sp. SH-PL17 TaxID=1630693 RepID=UPI0004B24A60|nr:hypothetical protein [Gemmata sp. SH-PL17]AMV23129.1 hypothetical protein VT84_01875 [Gemmata sp. SH-PL17]
MTTVTLADACLRLPELISLVARGEHVVIVQNGVALAALTPPAFAPPTPETEAARQEQIGTLSRLIAQWHEEDGVPFPPAGAPGERAQPESPAA